jgi:signal transduction histidine kinase
MIQSKSRPFEALGDYLAARREAILLAWRKAVSADPEQTTAHSLTRGQFHDHIPEVLDAFERKLRSRPGGKEDQTADIEKAQQEVKHGLHRWQQGYRLPEVLHEWGHLQLCLFEELETFATTHADFGPEMLAAASRQTINFVNEAITESAMQFAHMQQAEAAGHVHDLDNALAAVKQIERHRATLIHQAFHDLRGNVQSITTAADGLEESTLAESERAELTTLIQQGVQAVTGMLSELMELARLEAGQERVELKTFDAALLLTELGNVNRPIARERGLFLKVEGAPRLSVESDPGKVRRLLQNLLLNSLKYTRQGGVIISWGEEKENWWLMVKDTGPGILAGPGAPIVVGMQEATMSARESDEKNAASEGETSHVLTPPQNNPTTNLQFHQQPGEGIGLSIVKRLCELLDASLEMVSSAETGTTFRVVLPRHYQTTANLETI